MKTKIARSIALVLLALAVGGLLWPTPVSNARGAGEPGLPAGLAAGTRARIAHGEPQFGDPLPGLTPAEFELFQIGSDDFMEVEDGEEGLGPFFNGRSCAECHAIPAVGGSGTIIEIRAGLRNDDGSFTDFPGGQVFQLFSLSPHGCQKLIPAEANVFSRRKSLPLFGNGLVEAIPDETLLARAEANREHRDRIGGRAHIVLDVNSNTRRVGRFGWKAQQATLISFGAEAYRDEMGITSDLFGSESEAGFDDPRKARDCDPRPDPEDSRDPVTRLRGIDNFANFMRMLGPPPRGPETPLSAAGEQIFVRVGCAACHVPELTTGPSRQPSLDGRPVRLFSDLLLHDIGTGDELPQGDASGEEFRTTPLWGLRVRAPLLHDARANTIEQAIRMHENQALASRRRFAALSDGEREALLQFLRTL